MLLNSSSELGRLDAMHLGMWLNFDSVRWQADSHLSSLVAKAANLAYSDAHKQLVDATSDIGKREALISLFTSVAHEARHFHDLLMTPYGSILMNRYVGAAISILASEGSLFSSPAVIVPLADWPTLLPVLGKVDPSLQQPNPRMTQIIATLSEIERELNELDRGTLYLDASFSATSILESSAMLIQVGLAGRIFGLEAANQLSTGIKQSPASSRYFAALEFLMSQLGSLPLAAWSLLLLASLCGDVYNRNKQALRSPVDVLITMTRWLASLDGFPVTKPIQSTAAVIDLLNRLYNLTNEFFQREFGADLIYQLRRGIAASLVGVKEWESRAKGKVDDSLRGQRILQTIGVYRNFSEIGAGLVSNFAADPRWCSIDQYLDLLPYLPRPITYFWSEYGWPADPALQKDYYIQSELFVELPKHGPGAEAFSAIEAHSYNDGGVLRSALVISPKQLQAPSPPRKMFSTEVTTIDVVTWHGYFDAVVPLMRLLLKGPEVDLPGNQKEQLLYMFAQYGTKVYSRSGLLKPMESLSLEDFKRLATRYPAWPSIETSNE